VKKLGKIYITLVLLFLYVPIFVLIVFSFNESKSTAFTGFTFEWYEKLFRNDIIISSVCQYFCANFVCGIRSESFRFCS
jgi:spermidine/putrescine transport system permease protein